MRSLRGFTLIELLVTISIISILSAIAIVSYSGFSKDIKDARRKSDLKTIQSALESYHADQKYYPSSLNLSSPNNALVNSTGTTYLNSLPIGPTGSPEYRYVASGCDISGDKCVAYCLYAKADNIRDLICPSHETGYTLEVTSP